MAQNKRQKCPKFLWQDFGSLWSVVITVKPQSNGGSGRGWKVGQSDAERKATKSEGADNDELGAAIVGSRPLGEE